MLLKRKRELNFYSEFILASKTTGASIAAQSEILKTLCIKVVYDNEMY